MTNDYKVNLLNYLTGDLKETEGDNKPILLETETNQSSLIQDIEEALSLSLITIKDTIHDPESDNFIVYGSEFIAVVNRNNELIYATKTFSTGTPFEDIVSLNIDEDGYVYGVDYNFQTGKYRFIMLNQILKQKNDYNVVLRQSYFFPDEYGLTVNAEFKTKKAGGEAFYYFLGKKSKTILITVKVEVGTENEWNYYETSSYYDPKYYNNFIIEKEGENNTAYIATWGLYNEFQLDYFNGSSISRIETVYTTSAVRNVEFLTKNKIYYAQERNVDNLIYCDLIEYTGTQKRIFTFASQYSPYPNLLIYNGNIFLVAETHFDYQPYNYIIMVYDGNNYDSVLIDMSEYNRDYYFYVSNVFNLYTIYIQGENYCSSSKVILGYDYIGEPFVDRNCLNPNSVNIYNSDNKIVYSRGLYNKTINRNTTQASVELPNSYLNEQTLSIQNLLSKNSNIMVSNVEDFETNIYENIYVNYFNTLTMINKNDPNTPIENINGAIRLNNSISNLIDYDSAKLTKYRLNYEDGTTKTDNLLVDTITNAKELTFNIYVDKPILSIDLISDDENTIYNTITGNFEVEKTYKITQEVTIEDVIIEVNNLYYNNEPVLYKGEQVQVIGG